MAAALPRRRGEYCSRGSLGSGHTGLSSPFSVKPPPNYQLTPEPPPPSPHLPEGTMTFPSSSARFPRSRSHRCPLNPGLRSLHTPHAMPPRLRDARTLREICPHLCFCPSVRALNYKKKKNRRKSICLWSFQAAGGADGSRVAGSDAALALRPSTRTTVSHETVKEM